MTNAFKTALKRMETAQLQGFARSYWDSVNNHRLPARYRAQCCRKYDAIKFELSARTPA